MLTKRPQSPVGICKAVAILHQSEQRHTCATCEFVAVGLTHDTAVIWIAHRAEGFTSAIGGRLLGEDYRGTDFSEHYIEYFLKEKLAYETNKVFEKVAQLLNKGKVITWFKGRNEFSPSALGRHSADKTRTRFILEVPRPHSLITNNFEIISIKPMPR